MTGTLHEHDLARWIRRQLQAPLLVDGAVLEFFEATWGIDDRTWLTDLESGEAAPFLELLFYPDPQVRLAFETCWGENAFTKAQVQALADEMIRDPITTVLRMDSEGAAMSFQVPEFAVRAFIDRLRLTFQPPVRLHDILHGTLQGPQRVRIRARLRQTRYEWHDGRLRFLELFLKRMPATADDFDSCLDFLLGILSEFGPEHSPFEFLIERKLSFFQALCRNEAFQKRLRAATMETIMLQGTRVLPGNVEQWQAGMRKVDRICTALYGHTQFFERPVECGLEVRCEPPARSKEPF
jgi:hypothetical protein